MFIKCLFCVSIRLYRVYRVYLSFIRIITTPGLSQVHLLFIINYQRTRWFPRGEDLYLCFYPLNSSLESSESDSSESVFSGEDDLSNVDF